MAEPLSPAAPRSRRLLLLALAVLVLASVGVSGLARARAGLARTVATVDGLPVELITPAGGGTTPLPGVLVVHGFSGSRQLMYGIAQTLARNGYAAAVIDLPGHGQHPGRMARDRMGSFDEPLSQVTAWLRDRPGIDRGRLALVGHSMGAGAVVRYAMGDEDIGATVAISTGLGPRGPVPADVPRNVLAMAGAWEFPNVLGACRAAVTASYPDANPAERQGSWSEGTARQCTIVAGVEHIGVLFSGAAVTATVRWLDGALGAYPPERPIAPAMPMGPALWLHAAGALLFLLLAELLFPHARAGPQTGASLPRVAVPAIVIGAAVVAALVMRVVPGGWIPLLTADYLCGFFAVSGLVVLVVLAGLGRPVAAPLPSPGNAWRILALAAATFVSFALVAQLSWLNLQLGGDRRWLALAIFPACLIYFLAFDALLRTRPSREYFAWWAGAVLVTMAVLVGAVFTLRAPFFLLLLAPALLPVFLLMGLYGHWLRACTPGPWPAACLAAAFFAWLMAAVFPLV